MKSKSIHRAPAIRCAYSGLVAPTELKGNPRNPNKHPPEQLRIYAKILDHQGWRKAIVVSKRSGFIVTGHGAWLCAVENHWPKVPVDVQEFASAADEYAHMVADNRLPQMADMAEAELQAIITEELEGKLDLELAGLVGEEAGEEAEPEPQYPIVARVLERHDYVMVFCDNEMDFEFMQQLAGCRVEKSYKKKTVGIGRAVPFQRFMESLRANRDSLNEPRPNDHDAHNRAAVRPVRAPKPGARLRPCRPRADAPDAVKGLAAKRNWILERFKSEDAVVMLDDDLTGLTRLSEPAGTREGRVSDPDLVEEVITATARLAGECGCYLFGWQAADHPEYYSGHKPFGLTGYVNGCAIGFCRGHGLTFDARIVAKEDFDISAANAYKHRKCFRDLRYAFSQTATFHNPGGQSTLRNSETERADVELLKRKWGPVIVQRQEGGTRRSSYIGAQKVILQLPF